MSTFLTLLTGGGLAAVGGLASGWVTNWHAAKRDQRKFAQDREMAREARNQDRLDQAYMELGKHLSRSADWARSMRPFRGSFPAPDPLPPEERYRIETVVFNHGSKEVRRLLNLWQEQAAKIRNADEVIGLSERSRDPDPDPEFVKEVDQEWSALDGYKEAMRTAELALRERMRRELASEDHPGTPARIPRTAESDSGGLRSRGRSNP
jgi:hypothetical protein